MGAPLSAVRNRRNSRGVRRRRDRIPGDGLAGRGGDHRDHRRIGRRLRGGLRQRAALELPRPPPSAMAVARADGQPARAAQCGRRVRSCRTDRQPRRQARRVLHRAADLPQHDRRLDSCPSSSPTWRSISSQLSATSDSTACWCGRNRALRRCPMNPSWRSKLREDLGAPAGRFVALVEQRGTPFLFLQPHLAARRYRELTAKLPGVRMHYAVKAASHPVVLSTIAICGGGFDVATSAEVALLQELALPMDRCIHTNPIKKPVDIDVAYAAGIRTFVVENRCEVEKFAGRPTDIELLVRLAFRNPAAKSDLSSKFAGGPSDAELLVKHVIAAGVQFAGFSFHVGSQSSSAQPFDTALRGTLELATHIADSLGVRARVIDIGGGFPVPYREPVPTIDAIADVIDGALGPARDDF